MMVAMGHGLCVSFWVSGEMTKNKVGPKKVQCDLLARALSEGKPGADYVNKLLVWCQVRGLPSLPKVGRSSGNRKDLKCVCRLLSVVRGPWSVVRVN
jgi:hypothetical protein